MTGATPITEQMAELKRLAKAAAQGQWRVGPRHIVRCERAIGEGIHAGGRLTTWIAQALGSGGNPDGGASAMAEIHAAFIAAANPATVLALIAHARAETARADAAESKRDRWSATAGKAANEALANGERARAAEREREADKATIARLVAEARHNERIILCAYDAMHAALSRCSIDVREICNEHETRAKLRLEVFSDLDIPTASVGSRARTIRRAARAVADVTAGTGGTKS